MVNHVVKDDQKHVSVFNHSIKDLICFVEYHVLKVSVPIKAVTVLYSVYFLHLPLLHDGDIKSNPGLKKEKIQDFEACNLLYSCDFICLSETYLTEKY